MRIREKAVLCPAIIIFTMVMATVVWGQGVDYILGELGVSEKSTHHGKQNNAKNLGNLADLLKKSSTLRIYFNESSRPVTSNSDMNIEVIGTTKGAIVKYTRPKNSSRMSYDRYWVVELDMKEWHDFISSLYNSGISTWEHYYNSKELDGWRWSFKIYTENKKTLIASNGDQLPPNWWGFREAISNLISNITYKQKFKYNARYERMFGTPMSDLQSSVKDIVFYDKGYATRIYLTPTDTVLAGFYQGAIWLITVLPINDWLDIVRTLNIDSECANKPALESHNSNKLNDTCKITHLLSWDTFNKIMVNIRAKVRKNTDVDTFETNLEKEYRKRFDKQISEFERSLIRVRFKDSTKFVEVRRLMDGAAVTNETRCVTCLPRCIGSGSLCDDKCRNEDCRIKKLSVGEWLDFVHALYMISFTKWNKFWNEKNNWYRDIDRVIDIGFLDNNKKLVFRGYDTHGLEKPTQKVNDKKPKWNVVISFSNNQPLWYGDNEEYPPNWKDLSNLMSDLEAKILNSETRTDGR
jgi:hypothetical protein